MRTDSFMCPGHSPSSQDISPSESHLVLPDFSLLRVVRHTVFWLTDATGFAETRYRVLEPADATGAAETRYRVLELEGRCLQDCKGCAREVLGLVGPSHDYQHQHDQHIAYVEY